MSAPPAPGWPGPGSPFHVGERFLQERAGVRAIIEPAGRRMIRAAMPDQHRTFFAQLPYVVLGGVDAALRPWATVLAGAPGFVAAPDPQTLLIAALPGDGDPLATALEPGAPVAVLGIELATRRRNRANGTVTARDAHGLTIGVRQSFGNCPQYIQARMPHGALAAPLITPATVEHARLSPAAIALVRAADTFFIASATPDAGDARDDGTAGVDVSHRGGRPGFVRVDDDGDAATVLTFPDFAGNNMFNTLGNLVRAPRAGLGFVDFTTGALLSVTGATEIVWDGPEVEAFAGAQRLVRVRVEAGVFLPGRVWSAWSAAEPARQVAGTGTW